jgi:hypothetical protein
MVTTRFSTVVCAGCLTLCLSIPAVSSAEGLTMVVCAPGYPGSTDEAQPAMDDLSAAVAAAADWKLDDFRAVYFETEGGGLTAFNDAAAGLALVTLPFFLEHRAALELEPVMLAVPAGRRPLEPWTLIAGVGAVAEPGDLDGWRIASLSGHSRRFVRRVALGEWGEVPATATVEFSRAVLSSLRRAARGEQVAVLLDAEQAAALDRLPFADELEVVHRSRPLPVSVLCAVGDRVSGDEVSAIVAALVSLDDRADAAEALAGVRMDRFETLEPDALSAVERAFGEAIE